MNKKQKRGISVTKYFWVLLLVLILIALYIIIRLPISSQQDLNQPSDQLKTNDTQPNSKVVDNSESIINNIKTQSTSTQTKKKIAYAITVTKDGHFVDGALVLGYSAKKVHDAFKGYHSNYEADLIAFVAPSVKYARPVLEAYGWKVLERNLPVELNDIESKEYADNMRNSGCCGADEFLKLWAYTLVEYERVVHLDMDSIIYQNMDELYSIDKEMLFTGDWNMRGSSPAVPAQGGFLVIRPSLARFEEYRAIIRKGDYTGHTGWGNSHIGNFWGGQTIQGIVPYFYYSLHPGEALELNRCVYNCMVDNPYKPGTTTCLDGKADCQDCRLQVIEQVKSAHFTICQKPWTCTDHVNPKNKDLCRKLHQQWFQLREELERQTGVDISYRGIEAMKKTNYKESLGMCSHYGDSGYISIPLIPIDTKAVITTAAITSNKNIRTGDKQQQ